MSSHLFLKALGKTVSMAVKTAHSYHRAGNQLEEHVSAADPVLLKDHAVLWKSAWNNTPGLIWVTATGLVFAKTMKAGKPAEGIIPIQFADIVSVTEKPYGWRGKVITIATANEATPFMFSEKTWTLLKGLLGPKCNPS
ncbi:MAG: hypothetical protein U0637_06945 [Phycisphaerales bacterium]